MAEPEGRTIRWAIDCNVCKQKTVGEVKYRYSWDGNSRAAYEENQGFSQDACNYYVVACEWCGDAQFHGALEVLDDPPVRLWPPLRQLPWTVPETVRTDWDEAVVCYYAGAYAATVVMVRRMLEGVCREKDVPRANLNRMLDKMKEAGHIDAALAEWGHMLREVGNTGAHHGGRVSRENATDSLDFAEAFANQVFVLHERYNEYRTRRDGNASPGRAASEQVSS